MQMPVRLYAFLLFLALPVWAQPVGEAAQRQVQGILKDDAGKPVVGAVITVRAVTRGTGTRYGDNEDVEASTRTDAKGAFTIHGAKPFLAATVTAEAPGYAKAVFSQLSTGGTVHDLKLLEGVSLAGTVVKNGQPVAGIRVGLSDQEESSSIFTLEMVATTDSQGHFSFSNLPPRREVVLYGEMQSLRGVGAVNARLILTGRDKTSINLGSLEVSPVFSIEGRLTRREGASGPPLAGGIVVLRRFGLPDEQTARIGEDGSFRFEGVPAEIVTLLPGAPLTVRNASISPIAPDELTGRVLTNVADLIVELDERASRAPLNIDPAAAREEPLRGIEPPSFGPAMFKVVGKVLGAKTDQPVEQFEISEGRFNSAGGFTWFFNRRQAFTNGVFTTFLTRGDSPPALILESPDHLPWFSGPITGETNFVIELQKGQRVEGVVLKPDGSPAAAARVYLTDLTQGIFLSGPPLQLADPRNQNLVSATTDAKGRFSFKPEAGAVSVGIFEDAGFAHVKIAELAQNREIRLQPWARLTGQLMVGPAPGANEMIRLISAPAPYEWYPRELPALSLFLTTRTDTNGNFLFERAPPIMVEVAHSPETRDAALGPFAITQSRRLVLKPGETTRVTLGGQGRVVTGRFEVTGYDGPISWQSSPQIMEKVVVQNGPSDAAMLALLEKLRATARPDASKADREKAERDYQREREAFATRTREFFQTPQGMASLLESQRFYIYIADDGAFRIDDVPPGKYRVQLHLINADPAALGTKRASIAEFKTEITVPEGTGPVDLGKITIPTGKK